MPYIPRKEKVVFLTAFKGKNSLLKKSIDNLLMEMDENDIWVIVLDNQEFQNINIDKRIKILNYIGMPGAGNTRNYGLDYILKLNLNNFLLWPIDSDDQLIQNSRSLIDQKFQKRKYNMISFGCVQIYKRKKKEYSYEGEKSFRDLLKRYSTPCGSTIIRISDNNLLKFLRFSTRKRANDQLFFLSAARYFQSCMFFKNIVLLNYCQNSNSLSAKKWKQPFYKFLVLRDIGLNYFETLYFFSRYLIISFLKVIG